VPSTTLVSDAHATLTVRTSGRVLLLARLVIRAGWRSTTLSKGVSQALRSNSFQVGPPAVGELDSFPAIGKASERPTHIQFY